MATGIMTFGVHIGKTFEWVIIHDPDYIVWMKKVGADEVHLKGAELDKFNRLEAKARRMKVRKLCDLCKKNLATQMAIISDGNKRLLAVKFICPRADHKMPEGALVGPVSLLAWNRFKNGDKKGAARVVREISSALMGDNLLDATQKELELFFANDDNFTELP